MFFVGWIRSRCRGANLVNLQAYDWYSEAGQGRAGQQPVNQELNLMSQQNLQVILDYLNKTKTRCTYGALAEVLGVSPRSVGPLLGRRRPEASWVVNTKTGEPTGYLKSEKHTDLFTNDEIIQSASELRRVLENKG